MFLVISTIMNILLAAIIAVVGWLTYSTVPRFSRKVLTFEHDESVPVMNKWLLSGGDLAVAYGGNNVDNPHIVRFKLENAGKADVPSDAFDQATPIQFDFGVKIVAILHRTHNPTSLIAPSVVFSEQVLSIEPRLIPSGSSVEYLLLVDGSCRMIAPLYALEGVDLKERITVSAKDGMKLTAILRWAVIAFIVWWVIQEPESAARLVHDMGTLLSSAAHAVSNFVASI